MKPIACQSLLCCFACITGFAQTASNDPFDPRVIIARPPHDDAWYASRSKEDKEMWKSYLKLLGLPDISSVAAEPDQEIYRFTYAPHFSKPLVITVSRRKGFVSILAQRFTVAHAIELTANIELEIDELAQLRRIFAKESVANPLHDLSQKQRMFMAGLDGAWWHLETVKNGRYTHAEVWSPDATTSDTATERSAMEQVVGFKVPDLRPFEEACLYLVKLAGLPLDARFYEPRPPTRRRTNH